ncbi:MAG: diaminopimelate epimerase [Muribaculaceae bacterium]|nr:diaminopimelate epimerase [Muribaculaceae bacterium]
MKGKKGIPFVKMHGIGNDYIYLDALRGERPDYLEEDKIPDLSRKISNRNFGVGSDGLILILPSEIADFRMRIFNADGSEAKMCGNGIRCVGKYVYDLGFTTKKEISVETNSGIKYLHLTIGENGVESVTVDMGSPKFKRGEIPATGEKEEEMNDQQISSGQKEFKVTGVSMGNPHGVIFSHEVDDLNLPEIGPGLEKNSVWPDRANIEFVKVVNKDELKVRVWERGSDETLACGTGACASAVASYRKGLTNSEVTIHLQGGDLKVRYDEKNNRVMMTGGATFICSGIYYPDGKIEN